jgi:hypothetical protein
VQLLKKSIVSDDYGHGFEISPASPFFVLLQRVEATLSKDLSHGVTKWLNVVIDYVRVLLVNVMQVRGISEAMNSSVSAMVGYVLELVILKLFTKDGPGAVS